MLNNFGEMQSRNYPRMVKKKQMGIEFENRDLNR